jgi:hypothetical protein
MLLKNSLKLAQFSSAIAQATGLALILHPCITHAQIQMLTFVRLLFTHTYTALPGCAFLSFIATLLGFDVSRVDIKHTLLLEVGQRNLSIF